MFSNCVCLLLQYLLQSCSVGGRGIVEDMCCERRRAETGTREERYFNTGCACFPWFLSFGNRTPNSRVAGARPNHQPIFFWEFFLHSVKHLVPGRWSDEARSLHTMRTHSGQPAAASGCGSRGGSYTSWCKF